MMYDASVQALSVLGVAAAVTANNVANMNTPGFKASRADLASGPGDQGVRVAAITPDDTPGPLVPEGGRLTEGSNTDLVRELTTLMGTETAYGANAAVIQTGQELSGAILDLIV